MLVWVRKFMSNWVARVFVSLLVVGFVFWGISNVLTLTASDSAVAKVGGTSIDASVVQASYQAALSQASQQGQPDVAARQQLANQALADALRTQIMKQEERKLGVVVPDSVLRQALDAEPAFQTNGVFDKAKFTAVLQQNNSSPDQYLSQTRNAIADRQLLAPLLQGVVPPTDLINRLFAFVGEQRVAQTVSVATQDQAAPASPDDDVLQRFWRNHPAQFTAPEYRRIKLVILSPAILAAHEQIASADIDAADARVAGASPTVPQRSVQVISVGDLASSSRLEAAWKHGASWDKMQALAKKYGATSVELDQAAQTQIPAADLGQAVFAAPVGKIMGPVAGDAGMYVFKVTAEGQNGPDATTLRAQVTQQLQLQKAQADVAQDVDALQDALAGQTPLDQLPGNLGLAAVQGTLDAQGNTPDGTPAPIPGGDPKLTAAVLQAAFAAHQGDPAQLINGPNGSYFALTVDQVDAPALQPFAQVRDKVLAAWTNDEMMRAAEVKAAALLHAVQEGQSLASAAKAVGLQVSTTTPPLTRNAPPGTDTQALSTVLFSIKQGQATMLQTATGFTVAQLTNIIAPNPMDDPIDVQQLQQGMTRALQNDVGESFLAGLQTRDKVSVNQKMLAQIYQ
jgi:peptidyl-prolyl cis-trans isomerase D